MAISERQLLDALSGTPFVDSTELAGILGEPHATVHRSLASLLAERIVGRVSHGTTLLPSSQRYHLTAQGIGETAWELGSFHDQTPDHLPPEPLPAEPDEFWVPANAEQGDAPGVALIPAVSAALPKRLGSFPFWRGQESFITALEEIYRKASPAGWDVIPR